MKLKITVLLMVLIAAAVAKDIKYWTTGNETLPDLLMKQAPEPSNEPLSDPLVKQTPEPSHQTLINLPVKQAPELSDEPLLNLLVKQTPEPSDEPLLSLLVKQVMSQQLYTAERTRSEGDSGIKQVRSTSAGLNPYDSPTHSGRNIASIHNHANTIRTMGMGEVIAVLNGIEFRTRHNDYSLKMPSSSNVLHAVKDIPFPKVPLEVLQLDLVEEQVAEMQEWFRAFANQNDSIRDYRPYFKPILCYMEGAWVYPDLVELDSSPSSRHSIETEDWYDLQEKIRFTSDTGRKDLRENYAFLPTKLAEDNNGNLTIVSWNYRIMCHPLKDDLPLNRLRTVDDLATRLANKLTPAEYETSPGARYQINTVDSDEWNSGHRVSHLLDELMGQVPGKNNYGANLTDSLGGSAINVENDESLNVGYYNRVFKVEQHDAMGLDHLKRGFNDQNVFMAATTQEGIAPISATFCKGKKSNRVCKEYTERWTYAIPLEIMYLTPLASWNPYNLKYRGDALSEAGQAVTADRRNGGFTAERAYNGTNSNIYYMTPQGFYDGNERDDPADTTKNVVGVLDGNGQVRSVRASGHRIFIPSIPGVGEIRQRYPVMPIHGEGQTVFKELQALKDIVLNPAKYSWAVNP